jgi:hypothetical protein
VTAVCRTAKIKRHSSSFQLLPGVRFFMAADERLAAGGRGEPPEKRPGYSPSHTKTGFAP